MALTKITPQMFDTSATAHDLNVDNGTFVVDGSASRVGIGTSTPSTLLDVNGTATATTFVGALTGNVTGNVSGTAATVTGAAQTNITSVGTLSSLTTSGFAKADNYQFYQNSSATGATDAIYRKTTATLAFKTGSTERMTLDGSGNLVVTGGLTGSTLTGTLSTAAQTNITSVGTLTNFTSTGIDDNASSTAVTIDSSGNMQVGTTQTFPAFNNVVGAEVGGFGMLSASRTGAESLQLNRRTNDGTIALFKKDGTDIGLIGTSTGDLVIGTAAAALKFRDGDQDIIPWNGTTNGTNNGNYDLGDASNRFKDGHFSGSLYVNVGLRVAGHPVVGYSSITGGYAANLGSTGSSTLNETHIYVGGIKRIAINSTGSVFGDASQTADGMTGTPNDLNQAEVGPGYLRLKRDDTANAQQITFDKNGATHSYIETRNTSLAYVVTGGRDHRFAGGNVMPDIADSYDLGTSALRWRNGYFNDFHLSNEGIEGGNDVDGTTGDWTIQEGEEHLYIINNKTGKKFRFALEEVT